MSDKHDPLTGKTVPVFVHYAVPSVLGLLAISSASMIDAMFLGNFVGAEALAAVNLTVPLISLLFAVSFTLASGGAVSVGKLLGAGETSLASDVFAKALGLCFLASLALVIPALLTLNSVVALLGANEALTNLVVDYLGILLLFGPAMMLGIALHSFLIVDGSPRFAASALVAGAVLNVLLDWLLIVEQQQGLKGAAWASGISQLVTLAILVVPLFAGKTRLRLAVVNRRWQPVARASLNGISEFINEISVGIITLMFNWIMITRLGVEGVAAFTIVEYILFMVVMISYGFAGAIQPIISQNLGARQVHRMNAFLKIAIVAAVLVGVALISALLLVPEAMVFLFIDDSDTATLEIALDFIALFWPALLFVGMNIVLTAHFTALHKPAESAIVALLRSLIVPGVLLAVLPLIAGHNGIYIAVPVAEFLTFIVAVLLLRKINRDLLA